MTSQNKKPANTPGSRQSSPSVDEEILSLLEQAELLARGQGLGLTAILVGAAALSLAPSDSSWRDEDREIELDLELASRRNFANRLN